MPGSTPSSATPRNARTDSPNSIRRCCHSRLVPARSASESAAAMTTAPSVGWGTYCMSHGRQDQDQRDRRRPDHPGQLRLRPGLLRDRGAGAAGAHREALEEAGGDVGRPDPHHLLVAVHALTAPGRERGGGRHRVRQGHQGDPQRAEDEGGQVGPVGGRDRERREAAGQHPDRVHPVRLQVPGADRDRGEHDRDQHGRHPRQQPLQQQDAGQRRPGRSWRRCRSPRPRPTRRRSPSPP